MVNSTKFKNTRKAVTAIDSAMRRGKVTLKEWKVLESVHLATEEFQEKLIQNAILLGTLVEKDGHYYTKKSDAEVSIANFSSTLSEGWLKSNVLQTTLHSYICLTIENSK